MTNKIKFSHKYKKIWEQEHAQLIDVRIKEADNLHEDLIEYDTTYIENLHYDHHGELQDYTEGRYPLPKKGLLIQLTFMGSKGIPFCTLRRHTPQKWQYYNKLKEKVFQVVING